MLIDPVKRAFELRRTLVRDGKALLVDFSRTLQGKDTSAFLDVMPLCGSDAYPFRVKANIKEIDPLAAAAYQKGFIDPRTTKQEDMLSLVKRAEFDFPIWFLHTPGFRMQDINHYNLPFIMQVAGCNFHDGSATGGCIYCFVDDKSNDGMPGAGKVYASIEQIVESYAEARQRVNTHYAQGMDFKVVRASGGEPTVALDFILGLWREVGKRFPDASGQIDSNLSTIRVVEAFEQEGIYERHTLEKLAEHPVKVLAAIKGITPQNLRKNVQANASMKDQLRSLKAFIRAGYDIYPQMYNPDPNALEPYLSRMDGEILNFSLRVHIGPLQARYGPTTTRVGAIAARKGKAPEALIAAKQAEWTTNLRQGEDVMNSYLQTRYGVGYKDTVRSDVTLGVRR